MKLHFVAVLGLACITANPGFAQQAPRCDGTQDACQQIIGLATGWDVAFNKKDPVGLAREFTNDGMIVGEPLTIPDKAAIEKAYDVLFKSGAKFSNHKTFTDEIHVVGKMGWGVGSWSDNGPDPNGNPYQGRWSDVFVKDGGMWKIRVLTWNRIEPLPKPAPGPSANK